LNKNELTIFVLFLFFFYPSAAMAGLTDVEKAKAAAGRIFELIDRESEIDPLSDEGKKQN
jgi:hypothetical protein